MSFLNPAPYDTSQPLGTLNIKQNVSKNSAGSIQRKKTAKKNQRIQQLLETMTPSRGAGPLGTPHTSTLSTTSAVRQPGFESYSFLAGSSPAPALARQQIDGIQSSQRNLSSVGAGNPLFSSMDDGDDERELGGFAPPPAPISSAIERMQSRESPDNSPSQYRAMDDDDDDDDDDRHSMVKQNVHRISEGYAGIDSAQEVNEQKVHYPSNPNNNPRMPYSIPAYIDGSKPMNSQILPYSTIAQMGAPISVPHNELLEKLNKVVHLLEEQKHEKTGHITEELILYCFLGVFVIFIVDSFVRVGKYVR